MADTRAWGLGAVGVGVARDAAVSLGAGIATVPHDRLPVAAARRAVTTTRHKFRTKCVLRSSQLARCPDYVAEVSHDSQ